MGRTLCRVLVLSNTRASQVFPIGKSNCFGKKFGFGATAAIKQQLLLCRIWGGATTVVAGWMRIWCYNADYGGGGEQRRRMSWEIWMRCKRWAKQAAAGWSSVIYCTCLPIFLAPFYFSSLSGGVSHKLTKQVKGYSKAGIIHHGNNKDLKSPRGDNPGPFSGLWGWGSAPHFQNWCSSPEAGRRVYELGGWGPQTQWGDSFP